MSVRWKPLIILSGLFLVVGAGGLLVMLRGLLPRGAQDTLRVARENVQDGRLEQAKVRFGQAIQLEPRNARIHLEYANFLADWMHKDSSVSTRLRSEWLKELSDAARYATQMPEPRVALLSDALAHEEWNDAVHWARELEPLEPTSCDMNYVLAADALEQQPPHAEEARAHLAVLEASEAERVRTEWIQARLASLGSDMGRLELVLARFRSKGPAQAGEPDALARLQLRLLDITSTTVPATLGLRLEAFRAEADALPDDTPPARMTQVNRLIEKAQRYINTTPESVRTDPQIRALADTLAVVADQAFQKATHSTGHDLRPYQGYAEYLLYRNQRDRCLEVVGLGLAQPAADQPVWAPTVAELREIGIKAALADSKDPGRFEKAGPLIDALIASSTPRYQALGHLFRGVIDLELAGAGDGANPAEARPRQESNVASALGHLRIAAEGLKDVPTAQALYGVALVMTGEKSVGRQHLQEAYRMSDGQLDPRYQVWAAWSVLQAGYPESAEPMVARLLTEAQKGRVSPDLVPTLHLLMGEVQQSRGTAESRRKARDEYVAALKLGYPRPKVVELRISQLDALLGGSVDALTQAEGADAASEMVAIMTLREKGDTAAAQARVAKARERFPDDAELVGVEAALTQAAGDADRANQILTQFLSQHPGAEGLILLRASILSGPLKKPDEARELLAPLAESSNSSAALVQLAILEIGQKNHDKALAAIGQIRERWAESAAPDLLEAQLALGEGKASAAAELLNEALKKDPQNKIALFWKAQLDAVTGAPVEARQKLEVILADKPIKELQDGVPLATAAQWALAAMAMDRQEYGVAQARFEELLRDHPADQLTRSARWNLAMARAANGDPVRARGEVAELLRDPRTTPEERVQAADFYRRQHDEAAALREVDLVLEAHPNHPPAVSFKALTLTARKELPAALDLVRKAAGEKDAPVGLYLLLAALENLNGDAGIRTARSVLDTAMVKFPDNADVIRTRYQHMRIAKDPETVSDLEKRVAANPQSPARAVLVDAYRDAKQFDRSGELLEEDLRQTEPDSPLAATLTARLVANDNAALAHAIAQRDRDAMEAARTRATERVVQARNTYPQDPRFLELDAELALETGEIERARQLAQQLTEQERGSPAGPILKARVAAAEGRPAEAARAYEEALERNPRRADFRLARARAELASGRPDLAIKQASAVIEANSESTEAVVVKAQALSRMPGTPEQLRARRTEAAELLRNAIAADGSNADAYHLLSDLYVLEGDRALGIKTLEANLKALPRDDTGVSMLIQRLAESPAAGKPADAGSLQRASAVADAYGQKDESGVYSLAIAVGYHRAGRSDLAVGWAEKSAARLDRPIVHLTLGDILLAQAESTAATSPDPAVFNRVIEQYDQVLADQPTSVEAVNNKAWILHRYLGRHAEALQVIENLTRRVSVDSLPPDFLDTLGSIQAQLGKTEEARASYEAGLSQAPDHPILNLHMARLLAEGEGDRAAARACLDKARKMQNQMPVSLASEIDQVAAALSR